MNKETPPKWINRILQLFVRGELLEEIEGDLLECYDSWISQYSKKKADRLYCWHSLKFLRPYAIRKMKTGNSKQLIMLKHYFKISWRTLLQNQGFAIVKITGLALGLLVTMLVGLWTYDEYSYNKYHKNYEHIAAVMVHQPINGGIETYKSLPMPLSPVLRSEYGHLFEYVASTWSAEQTIGYSDKALSRVGCFTEPDLPEMLTLEMVFGTQQDLKNEKAIILSESLSKALFEDFDPIGKVINITGNIDLIVTGVYKDLPANSSFNTVHFFAPIDLILKNGIVNNNWLTSAFNIYIQLNSNTKLHEASESLSKILDKHGVNSSRSALFLNPMSQWHLYTFVNGERAGGRIKLVHSVTGIGLFILLLACINYINLATAQSVIRTKEVGIRKSIGSVKSQLIGQFLTETFSIVIFSFILSFVFAILLLPAFNQLCEKSLNIPWDSAFYWLICIALIIIISLLSGCYPAFHLSGLKPLRGLNMPHKYGWFGSPTRKVLVVVQFAISIILIAGTLVIYSHIMHAKDRSVGYERNGLLTISPPYTGNILANYSAFKNEIMSNNSTIDMALSSSPITNIFSSADNIEWPGMTDQEKIEFGTISVEPNYGSIVSWRIIKGRDFQVESASDSLSFIFNETAIQQMGINDPIGQVIKWHGKKWTIIGIVEDMVINSPFASIQPTVFMINNKERNYNVVTIKINQKTSHGNAISDIESVFKKFAPEVPFAYRLVDEEYALKFNEEEKVGKLTTILTFLAIIISCLGLIGLASFITSRRIKEIGIRKVLGASVFNLWKMLSKDFVVLVVISCILGSPVAYFLFNVLLDNYEYRTEIPWYIFVITSLIAILLSLITVSFQTIKVAISNPVHALKDE